MNAIASARDTISATASRALREFSTVICFFHSSVSCGADCECATATSSQKLFMAFRSALTLGAQEGVEFSCGARECEPRRNGEKKQTQMHQTFGSRDASTHDPRWAKPRRGRPRGSYTRTQLEASMHKIERSTLSSLHHRFNGFNKIHLLEGTLDLINFCILMCDTSLESFWQSLSSSTFLKKRTFW